MSKDQTGRRHVAAAPVQERESVLREIAALKADLAARRACDRPLRSSLVAAYQAAIARCYQRLDAADGVREAD